MTDEAKDDVKTEAPAACGTSRGCGTLVSVFAVILALASLAIATSPQLRAMIGETQPPTIIARTDEKAVAALNARLDDLNEKISATVAATTAPAEANADIEERLRKIEDITASNNAAMAAANEKLQQAGHLPAALALVRVEERFERGQQFGPALDALQKIKPLSAEDAAVLHAANGVPTTEALVRQLNQSERTIRRESRLAGVNNPLERIWAELQSLILIKTVGVAKGDVIGQSLADMQKALETNDEPAFEAAWNNMPEASRTQLEAWHKNVERRMAAHDVIERVMTETLVP